MANLRRNTPPTIAEVIAWSWWWNYPEDGVPHVLQLDVIDGTIVLDERVFQPEDWPGDWAPCLPPK